MQIQTQNQRSRLNTSERKSQLNDSIRSASESKAKLAKLSKILSDSNTSNIQALESIICDVKSNAFEKVRQDIESKSKEKGLLLKNIELLKSSLKLHHNEGKVSNKTTFGLINENKQLKAVEQRVNVETMVYSELENVKNEISKLKYDYENMMEENRIYRNEMLEDENLLNLAKVEIQRMNKQISETRKEKEADKASILQLKRHIKLMKEKVESIGNKNKDILLKFYKLSMSS